MKKKYNPDNCDSKLRAVFKDQWGNTISLFGRYAFEYSIIIEHLDRTTKITFKNGKEARKKFNELKKKK